MDKMESNQVKLPPNFDLRAPTAGSEWRFWKCTFEDYLIGTGQYDAPDKVKLALLRNMMGPEATKVLLTLKVPKEKSQDYAMIIQAIEEYVSPRSNEVFERFKFNERKQESDESFENYFTALRVLIANCNYEKNDKCDESLEDQLLRDRIVQGVQDKSLQENLLKMDKLTLNKAANICRASEASKLQVKEMNPTVEIDAAKSCKSKYKKESISSTEARGFDCRRCQRHHGPRECPAFGKKCSKCGILNHFAISCKVSKSKVREVKCDLDSFSESVFCGVVNLQENRAEWLENINIEGVKVACKLDTGADISVMPLNIFKKINKNLKLKLRDTKLKLESFSGEKIIPLGIANLMCKFKNRECFENFVIVNGNTSLLGLPGCVSLNLVKRVHMVQTDNKDKIKFIENYKQVFEGTGRLPGLVEIPTRPMTEQICYPASRLPTCMLKPLQDELDRLQCRNAIVKVQNINENACVNRIVIVEKPNGRVRLCLDPSDLNKYIVKKPKNLPTLDDLAFKLKSKKDKVIRRKEVEYNKGDKIVYKTENDKYWMKGTVVKKTSKPRSYWIQREGSDKLLRRSSHHLRKSSSNSNKFYKRTSYVDEDNDFNCDQNNEQHSSSTDDVIKSPTADGTVTVQNNSDQFKTTRSGRVVKPRIILDL